MTFCAICTSPRGPFALEPLGRDDAMVAVCGRCRTETPAGLDSERGYEPPYSAGTLRNLRNLHPLPQRPVVGPRPLPDGWELFRVSSHDTAGRIRTKRHADSEAYRKHGAPLRYLGLAEPWYLYARPAKIANEPTLSEILEPLR